MAGHQLLLRKPQRVCHGLGMMYCLFVPVVPKRIFMKMAIMYDIETVLSVSSIFIILTLQ